ncbi:MAG: BlaI/MecI/CopY family transcriptional regulator [Bacteroidota bacterium]
MKELTKAEEQIMQILWKLERGVVKDIIEKMPEPKPAYNTVSTIVRILETKGFVDHQAFGKTHQYFPLISKDSYSHFSLNNLVSGYFNGSFKNLVSFFTNEAKMDVQDIDQLMKQLDELKNNELKNKKP